MGVFLKRWMLGCCVLFSLIISVGCVENTSRSEGKEEVELTMAWSGTEEAFIPH